MHVTPFTLLYLAGSDGELLQNVKVFAIVFFAILAAMSLPLSLAAWRFWRVRRPRVIALSFADQQAFLYRLTEGLRQFGFRRGAAADGRVAFEPNGIQKFMGMTEIVVELPGPGSARITGSGQFIRNIQKWFPNTQELPYSGPIPWGRWIGGFLKVALGLLAIVGILIGGAFAYHCATEPSSSAAAPSVRKLDLVQPLGLTADEASHGGQVSARVHATGKALTVRVPPGVSNGARLRLRGEGLPGEDGPPAGGLYLVLAVE